MCIIANSNHLQQVKKSNTYLGSTRSSSSAAGCATGRQACGRAPRTRRPGASGTAWHRGWSGAGAGRSSGGGSGEGRRTRADPWCRSSWNASWSAAPSYRRRQRKQLSVNNPVIRVLHLVAGRKPHGRPRKTWEETTTEDRRASNITHIDPTDRKGWRTAIKEMNCPTLLSEKNGL